MKEEHMTSMRCYGVKEGWDFHMSLHEKPMKAYKEWISVKKTKSGDFRAPSSIFFILSLLIKPWITNWNLKWLTDSRHHVSTVRAQSSGSLTECVRSHLYPVPLPPKPSWREQPNCRHDPEDQLQCSLLFLTWSSVWGRPKKTLRVRKEVRSNYRSVQFFCSGLVRGAAAAPNPHRKAFIWDWF